MLDRDFSPFKSGLQLAWSEATGVATTCSWSPKGKQFNAITGQSPIFAGHKEVAVPFSVTAAFVMSSGQATS